MEQVDRLLRLRDVEALTGLSRSSIYRLEAANAFPRRVKPSIRTTAWLASEIHKFVNSRPRATPALGRSELPGRAA
jgi:prophage regulatory protein